MKRRRGHPSANHLEKLMKVRAAKIPFLEREFEERREVLRRLESINRPDHVSFSLVGWKDIAKEMGLRHESKTIQRWAKRYSLPYITMGGRPVVIRATLYAWMFNLLEAVQKDQREIEQKEEKSSYPTCNLRRVFSGEISRRKKKT
jgi:hypothetical protein